MQTFRAEVPELVRAHTKDEEHVDYLTKSFDWLGQKVLGPRTWMKWQKELNVFAQLSYYVTTTLAGLQTLGEEYVCLIQVHGDKPEIPSFSRRLAFVASQIAGPYLFEKFVIRLKRMVLNSRSVSLDSEQMILYEKIFIFLQRSGLLYVHRIHLALFYILGGYYQLAKRIFGVKYLSLRAQSNMELMKVFRWLGYLSLVEIAVSLSFWVWNQFRESLKKKINQSVSVRREVVAESSFRCDLCLENKPPACTQCGHLFCWDCLIFQATDSKMCPLCRSTILPSRIIPLLNL